jgi:LmbE family N-acetylglucosaminyl deacetylase
VLAPHHDDEVLGCGGLVAKLAADGAAVRVLFLSDGGGDAGDEARRAYVERRRAEARAAAKALGIAGIDELGLPDGGLEQHLEAIAKGLRRALLSLRPELLLVTSPLESSADHRAAFAAVHRLLGGLRRGGELWPLAEDLEILTYEVNHPLHPDLLVDVSGWTGRLEEAMACYESQQQRHDYLAARLGLARFRTLTLPPEVSHVEAYRRLTLADFTTRSPAQLIAELGGAPPRLEVREGPTMSVIVRTKDRPQLLAEALASLAASTYRRAEVVVVNDGGEPPAIPADLPLPAKVVSLETNRGRAAAANAGIAAARGDFIVFLDDDDLAFAEHLATLAGLVQAAGVRLAYTDAAVGVYELGDGGWECVERRLPYSRDFDPELLLVDNYIPFNTVAIDRRLVEEVGEMDTDLAFFEDWDYLIRLAERTPFHHLARVTCEYRQFRGGGHHVLGDAPRERADFLAMKARVIAKHASRLTPDAVARVVDRLRGETVAAGEEAARRQGELEALSERYHRLNGRLAALEAHQEALRTLEERGRAEIEGLRRVEREQAAALGEMERQLRRRDRVLEEQEAMIREQGETLEEHRRVVGEQQAMIREQGEALEEHRRVVGEQEAMIREQGEALEEHRRVVGEQEKLIGEQDRALKEKEETLGRTFGEIERLNDLIRTMESSRAWRLHLWLQRHKPGAPGDGSAGGEAP